MSAPARNGSSTTRSSKRSINFETPVEDIFKYLHRSYSFPMPSVISSSAPLPRDTEYVRLVDRYHELTGSMWHFCPEKVRKTMKRLQAVHKTMTGPQRIADELHGGSMYRKTHGRPPKAQSDFMMNLLRMFVHELEDHRIAWQREGGSSRGNFSGSNSDCRTSNSLTISSENQFEIQNIDEIPISPSKPISKPTNRSKAPRPLKLEDEESNAASSISRRSRRLEARRSLEGQISSEDGRYDDPDSVMLDDSSVALNDRINDSISEALELASRKLNSDTRSPSTKGRARKLKKSKRVPLASVSISSGSSGAVSAAWLDPYSDSDESMGDAYYSPMTSPTKLPVPFHQRPSNRSSASSVRVPGAFPKSPRGTLSSTSSTTKRKEAIPGTRSGKKARTSPTMNTAAPSGPSAPAPTPPKQSATSGTGKPPVPLFNDTRPGNSFAHSSSSRATSFSAGGSMAPSQNYLSTQPTSFESSFGVSKKGALPQAQAHQRTSDGDRGEAEGEDAPGENSLEGSSTEEDEVDPRARIVNAKENVAKGKEKVPKQVDVSGDGLLLGEHQLNLNYPSDDDDEIYMDRTFRPTAIGPSHLRLTDTGAVPSSSGYSESLGSAFLKEFEGLPDFNDFYKLPFHRIYEVTRVALHCCHDPILLKNFIFDYVKEDRQTRPDSLEDFWALLRKLAGRCPMPMHINRNTWSFLDRSLHGTWDNTIELAGEGIFRLGDGNASERKKRAWKVELELRPLENHGRSYKFARKFGSHRFMTIKLPKMTRKELPGALTEDQAEALVQQWIKDGVSLFGRAWEALYLREGSSATKRRRVVFFAVEGPGLQKISVKDVVGWHISISDNGGMTIAKFWSRIALGFSTTKPGMTFQSLSEIEFCPDTKVGDEVMDDGCAIASPAVFQKIKEILGLSRRPSAVQARIGGAKGVWMLDTDADPHSEELKIQIKDSQLKFNFHKEDQDLKTMDLARLTLDICNVANVHHHASMNKQFLPILHSQGVPKEAFEKLIREDIQEEIGMLLEKIEDPIYVKRWLETRFFTNFADSLSRMAISGALPSSHAEIARLLIDAGFSPLEEKFLSKNVLAAIIEHCDKLREKMHIRVSCSAKAMCVADPTGTLQEGEISFQFSETIVEERTGIPINFLEGDVLVTRNPAHLRTDVRKVRAVYNPRLHHLKDVVVFSTRGTKSLASYLSGGDYDGDEPWICWEPSLVKPFENAPESSFVFRKDDWFGSYQFEGQETTCSVQTLRRNMDLRSLNDERLFKELWKLGMNSSLQDTKVGILTRWFEQLSYQLRSIDHEMVLTLAHIIEHCLDAAKQGIRLKPSLWSVLERTYGNLPEPLYMRKEPPKRVESDHILDFVKLNVSRQLIDDIQEGFNSIFDFEECPDPALTETFKNEYDAVTKITRARKPPRPEALQEALTVKQTLDHINRSLDPILDRWLEEYRGRPKQSAEKNKAFQDGIYQAYKDIQPECDMSILSPFSKVFEWRTNANKELSHWNLLKASAAYIKFKGKNKLVWFLAAKELCFLKANSFGLPVRFVREGLYLAMKTKKTAVLPPPDLRPEPDVDTSTASGDEEFFDAMDANS